MMKEEELIRKYDSGRRAFTTPDGYFENFTAQLMERIEREGLQPEKVVRLNPFKRAMRYAAAAVVAGVCIGAGTYLYNQKTTADRQMAESSEIVFSDETMDEALDYAMECGLVDNNQIAFYLTEAY